jgi:hypothetical protein
MRVEVVKVRTLANVGVLVAIAELNSLVDTCRRA